MDIFRVRSNLGLQRMCVNLKVNRIISLFVLCCFFENCHRYVVFDKLCTHKNNSARKASPLRR